MKPEQLKEALAADGWRIEKHGYEWKRTGVEWWAWKIVYGFAMTDCTSNEKPPHIAVIPWEMGDDPVRRSVEFEVTGEVGNDEWINLKVYSVEMDRAIAALPRACGILAAAWNAAAETRATSERV